MSKLSRWDSIRSDDPPKSPDEIERQAFQRYVDRIRFLRLGGYPLGAAMIGAWRMGRGKPVNLNYMRRHPVLRPDFDPPTPTQMFARLGLLLVIALSFALVAQLIVWFPGH